MMQLGTSSNIPDINVFNTASFNEIDRPSVLDGLIEEFFFNDYGDRSLAVSREVSVLIANVGSAPSQDPVPRGLGTSHLPQNDYNGDLIKWALILCQCPGLH